FSSGTEAPAGTPQWWKKHKKQAVFVPGEGYRVEGFEGYYDQEGRPIAARVAKVVKQEKKNGLLHDAKVIESVADLKNQIGLGPNQQLAQQAFTEGEDLFRKQQYKQAAKKFDECIDRWPDSELEQDAMFYLAESQF